MIELDLCVCVYYRTFLTWGAHTGPSEIIELNKTQWSAAEAKTFLNVQTKHFLRVLPNHPDTRKICLSFDSGGFDLWCAVFTINNPHQNAREDKGHKLFLEEQQTLQLQMSLRDGGGRGSLVFLMHFARRVAFRVESAFFFCSIHQFSIFFFFSRRWKWF